MLDPIQVYFSWQPTIGVLKVLVTAKMIVWRPWHRAHATLLKRTRPNVQGINNLLPDTTHKSVYKFNKSTFSQLRLQGKFEVDHSWEWKLDRDLWNSIPYPVAHNFKLRHSWHYSGVTTNRARLTRLVAQSLLWKRSVSVTTGFFLTELLNLVSARLKWQTLKVLNSFCKMKIRTFPGKTVHKIENEL